MTHAPRWRRPLFALASVLAVLRVATGIHEARHPIPARNATDWRTPAEGLAESARTGRPVLYDFTASWCAPCKRLQREVFADPARAADIARRFVPVQVRQEDAAKDPTVAALIERHEVRSWPTLVVVSPAGGTRSTRGYGGWEPLRVFLLGAERELAR